MILLFVSFITVVFIESKNDIADSGVEKIKKGKFIDASKCSVTLCEEIRCDSIDENEFALTDYINVLLNNVSN